MIQLQLCHYWAGEDLRTKFCRRLVCTCKYITHEGFQVTSYRTRAWDVYYQDTAMKTWFRHYMLENRKSDHYLTKDLLSFLLMFPFCPQHKFLHACLGKIGERHQNPQSDYWTGAVCFLFQHIVMPHLGTAFTLSTLSTVEKYFWSF